MMRTTPAVREFTDKPVPDDVLHAVLDDARFAPSGGNRQGWRVVVLKDPTIRRRIATASSLVLVDAAGVVCEDLVNRAAVQTVAFFCDS